jgi:hypothetical protein
MEPMSYKYVDIDNDANEKNVINNVVDKKIINGDWIALNIKNKTSSFKLIGTEDSGDNYDYSPGKDLSFSQNHMVIEDKQINDVRYVKIKTNFIINKVQQIFS